MATPKKIVLIIDPRKAICRQITRGIVKYARERGNWLLEGDWSWLRHPWGFWRDKLTETDAIVIGDPALAARIVKQGFDQVIGVTAYRDVHHLPAYIAADTAAITQTAAVYLLELRLPHLACCGYKNVKFSQDRLDAFCAAIARAGIETHRHEWKTSSRTNIEKNDKTGLTEWLRALPKPAGVLACNDDCAIMVIEACRLARIQVPDHICVVGVDNDDLLCELAHVPLSSVAVDTFTAGYEAGQVLKQMMAGKKFQSKAIVATPTHVAERRSSDREPSADEDVLAAVRYIRKHADQQIQVDQVVAVTHTSRRALERHFQKELGRTVLDEIRRVRCDHIANILRGTNLSLTQIAMSLRFSDTANMSHFFKRVMGFSPGDYRKKHHSA